MDSAEVEELLRRIQRGASEQGMQQLLRRLTNYQLASTFDNFETESFAGMPWEPLAEVTTLQMITQQHERGEANILHPTGTHILKTLSIQVTSTYGRVFTPCPWAHVHNEGASLEGTAFGDITLPARTFLAVSEEDEAVHLEIIDTWVTEDMLGIH